MMLVELSFDDGHRLDLKLLKYLKDIEFPCTFYIPTITDLKLSELKELSSQGCIIGGHTTTHPSDLKKLSDKDLFLEIRDNKEYLEHIFQKEVDRFCYPRGRYDDRVINVLKKVGYKEARTTIVGKVNIPDDSYRWHTTVHVFDRPEYNGVSWYEYAKKKWHLAKDQKDGYFHLWGHSWEIEKYDLWKQFSELLKYIRKDYENLYTKHQ